MRARVQGYFEMKPLRGPLFALLAAVLFGLSPPLAKLLMGETNPHLLAGLLYLGSGIGLVVVLTGRRWAPAKSDPRPHLKRHEWAWLAGAIFFGGVAAPVL